MLLMSSPWVLGRLAKAVLGYAGAGLVGGCFLGWVADHTRGRVGEAVVHVVEADVVLDVGGCVHRIAERPRGPLVCALPVGEHELVVTQKGRLLLRESFSVPRGGSVVLTAWDKQGACADGP